MIPIFLIEFLARRGITGRPQRIVAGIVMALAALVCLAAILTLLWRGMHWYIGQRQTEAVTIDRAQIEAEATRRNLNAYEAADANMAVQAAQDEINDRELRDAVRTSDNSSVGPGTASLYERLRAQQRAGTR